MAYNDWYHRESSCVLRFDLLLGLKEYLRVHSWPGTNYDHDHYHPTPDNSAPNYDHNNNQRTCTHRVRWCLWSGMQCLIAVAHHICLTSPYI